MLKGTRSICLDICDYDNRVLCNLYDNTADISGQATNVFVKTERNGWKELSFSLPSTCITDEGEEENYRLQYLIADYRIRLQTDKETDWYLISEPKINHNTKAKSYNVVAGHISQLLKTKNLNLEFSDDEGNNVGTAEQLLTTILDGTGWTVGYVAPFLEDDGETEKVRSIVASAKTGAFMLISNLCEKFEAKPLYHGEGRIVDIVPLNPFSEVEGSEIPKEVLDGENVLELHYGYNISEMSRTLNTENLVTRLYAYGSYGDKTNGLCSLQTVEHNEYVFTPSTYRNETEFKFTDKDDCVYYFTASNVLSGDRLIWSDMDLTSRTYVWNETQEVIYKVYKEPEKTRWVELTGTRSSVKNRFDYLMDFNYYEKVGLLSDEMLLEIAKFQRQMPAIIERSTAASTNFLNAETELSRVAESNTGFLKLDVKDYTADTDGALILNLDKDTYSDGVIYRSDYDQARRNYFSWYCAEALKDNGDPTSGIGSVVYIIHNTNPVTWHKAYVKKIDNAVKTMDYSVRGAADPSTITLWLMAEKVGLLKSDDRFYLFSTNSISGRMGTRESEIESMQQTLQQATKVVTEEHPTFFVWDDDPAPDLLNEAESAANGYGWYYRAFSDGNMGELYFCYGVSGEVSWKRAFISETDPPVVNGAYYFNLKTKHLYHGEMLTWVDIAESPILVPTYLNPSGEYYTAPTTESKRLSQAFSKVAYYCARYDMLHKGLYDMYVYRVTNNNGLKPGNYAFKSEYGFYWAFSTDMTIAKNKDLWIDTVKYLVYQEQNIATVVKPEAKPYEAIDFPVANEFANTSILSGNIVKETGVEENSDTIKRTNHISLYANVEYKYSLPANSFVVFFDQNRRYLGYQDLNKTGTFTTGPKVKYARFVFNNTLGSNHYVQVNDYLNKLFVKETQYTILSPLITSGERSGMLKLVKSFADTADSCYVTYLKAFQAAQKTIKDNDDQLKSLLGDMYREGYWQKNEYVEGDEEKLYKDSLKNLNKIAKPEATYDIKFLDLYASNKGAGYSIEEGLEDIEWPDIEITDAIHLVDETIDVNCWAFIDKVEKCYDQPWKTQISINTNLSLIAQHSFTDVLARIAEVANETSANQTIYARAAAISGTGKFTANKLEGTINTNNNLIKGGASNWYTDSKGNIIFESTDGQSAMMLTGYGWAVSSTRNKYGDWDFRYTTTGQGMTADFLTAGEISAELLTAGSITTDKLNASVGQELEIGSNKSLLLYATVDGYRPSGGLQTQVANGDGTYTPVQDGDSYIRIAAQQGAAPAYIDIMTGGIMNLHGSTMNINASSQMNLTSGDLWVDADGQIHIKAGGNMDVEGSGNITVQANGSVNLNAGSDLNLTGATASLTSQSTLQLNGGSDFYIRSGGNMYVESNGKLDIQSGSKLTISSPNFVINENGDVMLTGTVYAYAGNIAGFELKGTYDTVNKVWKNQYMRTNSTTMDSTNAGIYLGYNGMNLGGKFKYNVTNNYLTANIKRMTIGYYSTGSAALIDLDATSANKGTISMAASSTVNIQADSEINISAGKQVKITSSGKVIIGSGIRPFTVSANASEAYIYNGMETLDDTTNNGVYVGTNGIALGKGVFKVTSLGALTASSADIMGEVKANTGRIGGKMVNGTLTGGWHVESDLIWADNKTVALSSAAIPSGQTATYRIYAGDANAANAEFYVMSDGTIKASKGSIAGWTITEDTIKSSDGKTGIFVGVKTGDAHKTEAAFWAGHATPSTANFYVTHGGILKATDATLNNATIYGNIYAAGGNIGSTITYNNDGSVKSISGGWSITSNSLSNNSGKTGMAYISGDSSIAFWAGNATPGSANFRVTNAGTLTAVNGVFKNASVDGTIEAVSGKIGPKWNSTSQKWEGGWNIANNLISSGATTTYVGISSDTGSDYAIWAGNPTAASANFYVKRNGYLYAKSGKIEGSVTIGAGTTIGGWYIGTDRIRSGNASTIGPTGMGSGTGQSDVAFWAGWPGNSKPLSDSQFYVTSAGTVVAKSATVTGTINATSLNIGGTNASFNVDSTGRITGLAFTSDKNKSAGFTFDTNGKLQLSTAGFDSLGNNSSGIYLTPTSVKIGTTGTFELKSTNFEVTTAGVITSKSGTIGGWTISAKQLNSGKDNAYQDQGKWVSTYVGLSSDEANAYAFWCGSSNAANAPFRVRRNGLVYLLKVVDLDENGNEKVVDLGKYSLGKLQYSTVVSVSSDGTVKLSNGTTFNSAASVSIKTGSWSGSGSSRSFDIELSNKKKSSGVATVRYGWNIIPGSQLKNVYSVWIKGYGNGASEYIATSTTVSVAEKGSWNSNHKKTVVAKNEGGDELTSIVVDATSQYNDGYNANTTATMNYTGSKSIKPGETLTVKAQYYNKIQSFALNSGKELSVTVDTTGWTKGTFSKAAITLQGSSVKVTPIGRSVSVTTRGDSVSIQAIGNAVHFKRHTKNETPSGTWYTIVSSGYDLTYYLAKSAVTYYKGGSTYTYYTSGTETTYYNAGTSYNTSNSPYYTKS